MNVIGLYLFIIFVWVIASWLQMFGVINTRNPMVRNILNALSAFVEPVIAPIRRVIPSMGGLDLSPIILIFALYFVRDMLVSFHYKGSLF
jgi:YggT family protein